MKIGYIVPTNRLKFDLRPFYQLEIDELKNRGYKVFPMIKEMVTYKKDNMDLILSHMLRNGQYIANEGIPFITIHHGTRYRQNSPILDELQKNKNCKAIGTDSRYNLNYFKNLNPEKLFYTPTPVRTNLFKREKPLGDKVIAGGRICEPKGFHIALEAYPDLWIFGSEVSSEKDYYNKVVSMTKPGHIVGWLFGEKLKELMEEGWLFIHANSGVPNSIEGTAALLKEAMLMELQVIANPVGGVTELKYINFSEPTSESIKSTIDKVEKKPNIEGRDFMIQEYNVKHCVEILDKLIQESI